MAELEYVPTVGERVRSCRRYRGVSLQVLADRTGLSKSFLSMVENGQRQLDRRRHISAIADALQVSVTDLTGQPFPPAEPHQGGAHATVPAVRLALIGSSLDYTDRDQSRPVDQLARDTVALMDLRQACKDEEVGRTLGWLLSDLHVAVVRSPEREPALRSLVLATKAACSWLKSLGYPDLAWIAADRGWQAACRLDDPLWIAAADYSRTQALSGLGAYGQMSAIASHAAESTPTSTGEGLEVLGMHRLTQALSAATTGQGDAHAALAQARDLANRTGQGVAFWMAFGPVNVVQWEMSVVAEEGDPERAVQVAETIRPEEILSPSRRASYYADLGLALALIRGRDQDAVTALQQAERLAPDRVRNNPRVRETVNAMLQRSRREAGGRALRGLAHRVGVVP